jgi:hypothetical protein
LRFIKIYLCLSGIVKKHTSIKFKAAFLLIIFAFNTIVGFACVLGVDVGFNATHHHDEETENSVHIHANGEKHHHDEEAYNDLEDINLNAEHHQHNNESTKNHYDSKESSEKDDCCNDKVIKLQNLDKNINQNSTYAFSHAIFIAIINNFFGLVFLNSHKTFPQKTRIRFFYPPPPDILISIQRFQI